MDIELDILDQRLLHALQIYPRATWRSLAPIVGVDQTTLARRWDRLTEEGVAYSTGYPQTQSYTIIEVLCEASKLPGVAAALTIEPAIKLLEHCTGDRSLLAHVLLTNRNELSDFLMTRLSAIDGIGATRIHAVDHIYLRGVEWKLQALTPHEESMVTKLSSSRPGSSTHVSPEVVDAILREVWVDGRVPVNVIAERHGISPHRISRGLGRMREAGMLEFRIDVARPATNRPVTAWYFIEAPPQVAANINESIIKRPESRVVMSATDRHNILICAWLKTYEESHLFEAVLERGLPGARVTDRATALRRFKHLDYLIGADGRAIGHVPPQAGPTV
ncbi:AsnC family transcriptional regulator [Microbacterium sp. No. 7]|uniref:AsnC family transcriptional regulator n=1 Tax=Microbacterium sp. No. 7 TaxID=1714373 RepID=UPI0006D0CD4D|nr:AsnC family transcriptional regulator [Microbacterium sp. No. 7]ALJ18401.1 hypothetical protein AOA12_00075 [Microbacterium sp. No. 7]